MMGLDFVELVMKVEDEFDVRISDTDTQQLHTFGDLADHVWNRLSVGGAAIDFCPTSRAFYDLRRRLIDLTGAARRSIRPSTRVETLLPRRSRVRTWTTLRNALPVLPNLEPSSRSLKRHERAVTAGAIIGAAAGPFFIITGGVGAVAASLILGVGGAIIGGFVVHAFTSPFLVNATRHVPQSCATVGDVALFLAAASPDQGYSRALLEHRLRHIVADVLCVEPAQIHRHSRFVEDLGAA